MENDNASTQNSAAAPATTAPAATDTTTVLTKEVAGAPATTEVPATTDGAKPAGEAGGGDQPVVEYKDFTLPEGVTLDSALLEQATPIFKELGLSKEQAQKLVNLKAQESQQQADAFNQQLETWRTSAKADKEYGGDLFEANIALARSAMNRVGTPELKQLLNDSGVGDHPEVIRLMVRVGKMTAEDNPTKGRPAAVKQDNAAILYPNDTKA